MAAIHANIGLSISEQLLYFKYRLQEMSEPSKLKSTITTETDEWGRKKYRIEQRSQDEQEVEAQGQGQGVEGNGQKSMLVGREEDLNIEKYVGRIEKNKKSKKKEVFYCEVCKEGFKCDLAYITHLNSPHHNRKLGMSMKVKAVSTETVIEKLKSMRNGKPSIEDREMARFHQNAFVKKYTKEEEEKYKIEQGEEDEALQGNQQEEEEEEDVEAEMRALGLPTCFASKKQKR